MLDLRNATFIIPVRIDSWDRAFNFEYVLSYLCRNLETNIMIFEQDSSQKAYHLLKKINKFKCKIDYRFEQSDDHIFHRTRLLNEMLFDVETACVINYDADVLLKPSTYLKAYEAILHEGNDLVYPFFFGESQHQIIRAGMDADLTEAQSIQHVPAQAQYGHCQFFKTESYKQGGGENENFISWGPEDQERAWRFKTLGYNVKWLEDCYVYHIEHSRNLNSGRENPHFENNEKTFDHLKTMTPDFLREYYKNIDFLKKYRKRMITLLTYSDHNYRAQQEKLVARAVYLETVDKVVSKTREDLVQTEFYKDNKELLDKERGAGYWVWKPYYILETLKSLPEDDILIYIDCGDWISANFKLPVNRKMRTHDLVLTAGSYENREYTKRDCFIGMDCDKKEYHDAIQIEAGIILLKNTPKVIEILEEWLKWCLTPGIVTDDISGKIRELEGFKDHRHDQSVLSLLAVKHEIETTNELRQYINCNQQ